MNSGGCLARCTFCDYLQTLHGCKYRTCLPQHITDEFKWMVDNMLEIREIGKENDTFTGSQKKYRRVLQETD